MRSIHQRIHVSLPYTVHFTTGVFDTTNPLLRDVVRSGNPDLAASVLVVVDRAVAESRPGLPATITAYFQRYASVLELVCPPLVIPGGEPAKNAGPNVTMLHEVISDARLGQPSYVLPVGGGAILDMVGYAASTAQGGLRVVRVPTTVLAQGCAGVSVRNRINAFGKKNFLGTCAPPFAVVNDESFLTTLSDRDWRGGLAEAVKVALIGDPDFFEFLETQLPALARRDLGVMSQVVYRCATLHLHHLAVDADPFQRHAAPLDFGYWAAHKLEALSDFVLRHGEAVAIGLALDATYSCLAGFLGDAAWHRIMRVLTGMGFDLYDPALSLHLDDPAHPRSIFQGLAEFHAQLGGPRSHVLLRDIGRILEVRALDPTLLAESVHVLERSWLRLDQAREAAA